MRRRWAATGIAVLASLTVATAACAGDPATTPAPDKPATEVLGEAAAKTKDLSFRYTLAYGTQFTGGGTQDGTGRKAMSTMTALEPTSGLTIKGTVLLIGDGVYLKLDLGPLTGSIPGLVGLGDKWMHLERKRIGTRGLAATLTPGGDSMKAQSYIKGVISAERVSDTEFKGIMDLAKSAPRQLSAADIAKLSPEDRRVPFTATLDGSGRIARIAIAIPALGNVPAADLTTGYADYGAPVNVAKPAASKTVEAPAMIFQFLG